MVIARLYMVTAKASFVNVYNDKNRPLMRKRAVFNQKSPLLLQRA